MANSGSLKAEQCAVREPIRLPACMYMSVFVCALQLNMLMRLQEAAGFTNTDSSQESGSVTLSTVS